MIRKAAKNAKKPDINEIFFYLKSQYSDNNRDPQEKENRNKKSGKKKQKKNKNICIISDSMVKHITGPGISENDQVQVKTHSGAATQDIIDYIKPTIRQKPDIAFIHSGTNDLTKDMNTMSRVRKVVAAVKKIDTEGKIKLGFSGIAARGDINKEEDIVITNNRLEKYCKGNEFFFINNSNIDLSCLNKSKLHLSRKGTHYLAKNFRKHIFNIELNIYDSVKRGKALHFSYI